MDPRDFLKLAVRLSRGSSPAETRTCIGRSYYAAFNVAAEQLRSLGIQLRSGPAAHGEIRHSLANAGNDDIRKAAIVLGELHSKRIRADYQLDKTDIEKSEIAASIAAMAEGLIRTLDTTFHGPQRASLQAAITQWRRENGYP